MHTFFNHKTEEFIGLTSIIEKLTLLTRYGKKQLEQVVPYRNVELLRQELDEVEYVQNQMKQYDVNPIENRFIHMKDIETVMKHCQNDIVLDVMDLYEIKLQAIYMNELKDCLNEWKYKMKDCGDIISILSPENGEITLDFYLYSDYSSSLKEVRDQKRRIEQVYYQEKDVLKKQELKEQRSHLVILEAEEELKVRKLLTKRLSPLMNKMLDNIKIIGQLDIWIAKVKLANQYHGIKPEIASDHLLIEDMLHPVIFSEVNHYTSNTIEMNNGSTIITGANMGGKTTILKTVALNVMLAHLGFFVFAKKASIPMFDIIHYIGVNQQITHGLSSFGYEMMELNQAIQSMKQKKCLIIADELARSTNPNEGQKFVRALALFSKRYHSMTLIATHYDHVVSKGMNHYQIKGLKENAITLDLKTIHQAMDYQLIKVNDHKRVPKEAYQVSVLLGLDREFKEVLDQCYRSDVNE